jgi:hypothetical protein
VVFQAYDKDGNERRALQQQSQREPPESVEVTFDQCVFVGNHYPGGVPIGLRQLGVITMHSSAGGVLNVTNSLFVNNEFVVSEYNVSWNEETKNNTIMCGLPDDPLECAPHRMRHLFVFVVFCCYTHTQAV